MGRRAGRPPRQDLGMAARFRKEAAACTTGLAGERDGDLCPVASSVRGSSSQQLWRRWPSSCGVADMWDQGRHKRAPADDGSVRFSKFWPIFASSLAGTCDKQTPGKRSLGWAKFFVRMTQKDLPIGIVLISPTTSVRKYLSSKWIKKMYLKLK